MVTGHRAEDGMVTGHRAEDGMVTGHRAEDGDWSQGRGWCLGTGQRQEMYLLSNHPDCPTGHQPPVQMAVHFLSQGVM